MHTLYFRNSGARTNPFWGVKSAIENAWRLQKADSRHCRSQRQHSDTESDTEQLFIHAEGGEIAVRVRRCEPARGTASKCE